MLKSIINFLSGLFIIFLLYYFCFYAVKFTGIQFPPAILAMILFVILLNFKIIKKEWVELTSKFFLNIMPLLFVPFIVGLMVYKSLLISNWCVIFLTVTAATALTIAVSGLLTEYGIKMFKLIRIRNLKK